MSTLSKRALMIRKMHEQGLTYEQIGDVLGITKQAVHQASMATDGVREKLIQEIPYVGLRNWMLDNRISFRVLSDMCGRSLNNKSLRGEVGINKKSIDAILRITGLTYEECFKEEDNL